jgi:hypothetical protein
LIRVNGLASFLPEKQPCLIHVKRDRPIPGHRLLERTEDFMRTPTLAAIAATLMLWVGFASALADRQGNEAVTANPGSSESTAITQPESQDISGHWYRGEHNGRHRWWWIVGREWFPIDRPAALAPERYAPPHLSSGWWYLCPDNLAYYPFVPRCMSRWVRVRPR